MVINWTKQHWCFDYNYELNQPFLLRLFIKIDTDKCTFGFMIDGPVIDVIKLCLGKSLTDENLGDDTRLEVIWWNTLSRMLCVVILLTINYYKRQIRDLLDGIMIIASYGQVLSKQYIVCDVSSCSADETMWVGTMQCDFSSIRVGQ